MATLAVVSSPKVIDQKITEDYALFWGDNVPVVWSIPDNSLHYGIWSPPFAQLYSYSDAVEDMSNVLTDEEFFHGLKFLHAEIFRALMPGRLISVHCMNLPCTIERDGYIGLRDFRGRLIREMESIGFIFHSEVVIWKDPLTAATRTHAIGLAHKQIVKDSSLCRQGIPDFLVTMRKPGINPEAVSHEPSGFSRFIGNPEDEPRRDKRIDPAKNKYSHEVWQKYASPVWMDINPSDTLQKESARDEDDQRHICPLQLQVIQRGIELWSNPGDVVLDPFAGIGSTGFVALKEGRRFLGVELKDTYFRQAHANLEAAILARTQERFAMEASAHEDIWSEPLSATS